MSKSEHEAGAFYLQLDTDDLEGDQIKYLTSILNKYRGRNSGNFSIRFTYNLDSTSHWDGKIFVIDSIDGVCHLRLATFMDGTDPKKVSCKNKDWLKISETVKTVKTAKNVLDLVITLEQPIHVLNPVDLHTTLKYFQVADTMFI